MEEKVLPKGLPENRDVTWLITPKSAQAFGFAIQRDSLFENKLILTSLMVYPKCF
jgi:hypothetical protein